MPINIPTIINELRENATEQQRTGLSILENRFYECIELKKKLDTAVKALEEIERKSDKFDNSLGFIEQLDCIKADCQDTLYYLKEIDLVGTSEKKGGE